MSNVLGLHSNLVYSDINFKILAGLLKWKMLCYLNLLKVLILLKCISSILLQVYLKCKRNWLLSQFSITSCRFLIQLLGWEHT